MYSCHNREKLPQQVPTILSSKPKISSQFSIAVLKFLKNFQHFERKDQLHAFNISGVMDSGQCGYLNAQKLLFQNTLWKLTC